MIRQAQAYNKINILENEIKLSEAYMQQIINEKDKLRWQYMDIPGADAKLVGKEMNRLNKEYNKHIKRIDKNNAEISRLRRKYGI